MKPLQENAKKSIERFNRTEDVWGHAQPGPLVHHAEVSFAKGPFRFIEDVFYKLRIEGKKLPRIRCIFY